MAADPRVADLKRAGRVALAIFLPQYAKDAKTGALRGIGMGFVAMEMGRALAGRLGIELALIEYPTPVAAVEGLKAGACDLACLGIDPKRQAVLDFSAPVVEFDYTMLVPTASDIKTCADADRTGTRIAVVLNHASTFALERKARHARLVGTELPDAAFALLRGGAADAFAAPREQLLDYAAQWPEARVLDDAYGVNRAGFAIAKNQPDRLGFIAEFVDRAKTAGTVADIIKRGHLRGFRVAPAAGV